MPGHGVHEPQLQLTSVPAGSVDAAELAPTTHGKTTLEARADTGADMDSVEPERGPAVSVETGSSGDFLQPARTPADDHLLAGELDGGSVGRECRSG